MTSVIIQKIEQRWQMPFWELVSNLAAQDLSRADAARAIGFNPHSFRYHLAANPDRDPFPPVYHPPKDYASDTGESFREACIRMSATHTVTQAARETGYADSSCFKRAMKARGLQLTFQKYSRKTNIRKPRREISDADAERYAELRIEGVTHKSAAAQVGFSGYALRYQLKRRRPDLWTKVERIGRMNSREMRKMLKGAMHIPFSDEQIQNLCASYEAGASIYALSVEYGISDTAVRYRLKVNGVKIRPKGPRRINPRRLAAQIGVLKQEGMTIAQVCGRLGISPTTYYRVTKS